MERSEPIKSETQDRLSPLTSSSIPFLTMPGTIEDPNVDLEKFVDNEMEATTNPMQQVGRRIGLEGRGGVRATALITAC